LVLGNSRRRRGFEKWRYHLYRKEEYVTHVILKYFEMMKKREQSF
jgi:hypothetical protein